ncbi:SpoIIE family protein phosphatase [Christensenellaceae bacterium OttesenSCG-928-M15]|nr:SpoIIE family protein phosphatase [Christensenellaceae bacterium OttesenSCG-928-M15]
MQSNDALILQGVLDSMPDMVRVLDLSQKVLLINKCYKEQFGDQTGRRCHDMFRSKQGCRQCLSQLALTERELQRKTKRFRKRTYLVKASPIFGADGNLMGTVETFRDITQENRTNNQLRERHKLLLVETDIAAKMQRNLFLTQGKPDDRVEMLSSYLPASSLGGDMFGCLAQKDGDICFYVADVSGHGLAAAMITLFLASILRGMCVESASQVLDYAREAFLSLAQDDQLYVSMFAAILNPKTGELRWANAGLNAVPLLVSGKKVERLYSPALPLCNWEEHIEYKEHLSHMPENGKLLLYTDGLLDEKSSRLTEESLMRRVVRMEGKELINSLERTVIKKHEDDVCMLLVARKNGSL